MIKSNRLISLKSAHKDYRCPSALWDDSFWYEHVTRVLPQQKHYASLNTEKSITIIFSRLFLWMKTLFTLEDGRGGVNVDCKLSVFSIVLGNDSPSEFFVDQLHSVADTQHRKTTVKDSRIVCRSIFCIYRSRSSRNNDTWLKNTK